jgi:hypothetical protein
VKDDLAGRKIRCPGCKEVLKVPEPAMDDEDAAELLLMEGPPPAKPPQPPVADDYGVLEKVKPKARRIDRDDDDDAEKEDRSERRRRKRRDPWRQAESREERGGAFSGIAVSPSITTGMLMMVGAVVWFCLGIMLIDTIFFYPPVMFVLGAAAVVKGILGRED